MPLNAISDINNGKKPVILWENLLLGKNECCHYVDNAIYEKAITHTQYRRVTSGWGNRGNNGKRYYNSISSSTPYTTTEHKSYDGMLCVTNKRIIFTSKSNSFSFPITSIYSYEVFSNCVILHCNKGTYSVFVPNGNVVIKIIKNIVL